VRAVARRARALVALSPTAILTIGWIAFVIYAFPGLMTMDSFDQLREGRGWEFTDSHPPAMAALWGIVDRLLPGPLGMLLLQGTGFLAGAYLVLRRAMRPTRAAWCAVAVLLFPPVLTTLAVIWKDCLMAALLVLAIPALLSERRRMRVLGLVLCAAATAMRYNALAATFPLIVVLFEVLPGRRWFVRYPLAVAVWLAVTLVGLGASSLLVDREIRYWYSSSALADITGVLAQIDRDISDAELRPLLAPTEIHADTNLHAAVRAKYKPHDFQQLITGDGHLWTVPWGVPMPEARQAAVAHAWREIVLGNVGAYASYRVAVFSEVVGLGRRYHGGGVLLRRAQYAGMLDYMGVGRGSAAIQENAETVTIWLARKTRLYRPYIYLLLALLLLPLCRNRDVLAVLLSGLAMEASLLVLAWTPDFRFSHWLVTCTCLATLMLIARRAKVSA
jgi:hypothetical protein